MAEDLKLVKGSEIIMEVGKKLISGFNLDNHERRLFYEQVFYLLSGSIKVVDFGLKPGKGILLQGDIGVGKTVMMKTMQVLFNDTPRKFKWVNCLDFKDMLDDGLTTSEIKLMIWDWVRLITGNLEMLPILFLKYFLNVMSFLFMKIYLLTFHQTFRPQ
jgi:energy-coupling factor transporter ATP-binding protein EcfA2